MDINLILFGALALAVLSVGGALIVATILASKALGVVRIDSSVRVESGATTGDVSTGNGKLHEDWYYDFFMRLNARLSDVNIELERMQAVIEERFNGDPEEVLERTRAYIGLARLAADKALKGEWDARWRDEDWWNAWVMSADHNGYFSPN